MMKVPPLLRRHPRATPPPSRSTPPTDTATAAPLATTSRGGCHPNLPEAVTPGSNQQHAAKEAILPPCCFTGSLKVKDMVTIS
ncbi:hypothetical protein PVAP13_8NG193806 [Panicum virgatum]|uniref:Uncharacterized protein n=1 Tax=Panicum virgatum TaxID=38727 RepID=A0A8T0P4F9_PANVG|nr:hypothetical protein PVAP13_8NG193806 [Panicum virgatum]KAG2556674.1 hypothetical protein PVAP13_8NG193806 [Panicum virgatum]